MEVREYFHIRIDVMSQIIKNGKDLDKLFKKIAYKMLSKTRNEIYNAIQQSIKEYYLEYTPSIYKRKYKFLSSLVKTEIKQSGNKLWCEVKIDETYLNYTYPYIGEFNPSYPHDYDGRFATGKDVVNWANREFPDDDFSGGNHGFTIDAGRDDGFWDGTLKELGDIILLLKKNLKNQGIKII